MTRFQKRQFIKKHDIITILVGLFFIELLDAVKTIGRVIAEESNRHYEYSNKYNKFN